MLRLFGYIAISVLALAAIWWLADVYHLSFRDPRFFDGWILFAAMAMQMLFHIKGNMAALDKINDARWTQFHILVGYIVIGGFFAHTRLMFPNSALEGALWAVFALVVVSGIVGSILTVAIPVRLEQHSETIEFNEIPDARSRLALKAEELAVSAQDTESLGTIWDLYSTTLRSFFNGPRNVFAHIGGSKLPLRRLCHEIEASELTINGADSTALQSLKTLVVEKDRLDFRYANQGLLYVWTFVHVPATYGLIVLTSVHVAIVYAFSSGVP